MAKPIGDPVARFWKYVDKSAGADGCWPWLGARNGRGYGKFNMGGRAGANEYAHRAALLLTGVAIPPGFNVCHRCDTPQCVNAAHLFVGTHADNMQDMRSKGRHWATTNPGRAPCGERCPQAKLTASQVVEIRASYAAGKVPAKELARRFGVGRTTIGHILRRENWRSI